MGAGVGVASQNLSFTTVQTPITPPWYCRPTHLLPIGVVDLQLSGPLAGQGPVADHQAGRGRGAEDGLAGCAHFDLTASPLQLLQELSSVFCTISTQGLSRWHMQTKASISQNSVNFYWGGGGGGGCMNLLNSDGLTLEQF